MTNVVTLADARAVRDSTPVRSRLLPACQEVGARFDPLLTLSDIAAAVKCDITSDPLNGRLRVWCTHKSHTLIVVVLPLQSPVYPADPDPLHVYTLSVLAMLKNAAAIANSYNTVVGGTTAFTLDLRLHNTAR